MIRATAAALYGFALALAAQPAQAGLTLCNRTSYRVDAAFGLEKQPKVATRGWFKLDPGECKEVVDGTLDADMVYVHSRTPPVYGTPPEAETGQAELCVRAGDFDIPDGRDCPLSHLLTIAGYDAYPIDGVKGTKTEKAIAQFLSDHKLSADEAFKPGFFDTLLAAARNPQGKGFSWCNDTRYTVMASLGVVEMGAIVTRGWYRIAAGKCLRPVLRGHPHRLYSYAEAVDDSGRMVMREGKPLAWGGSLPLCTRGGRFALSNHKDCSARGLKSAGFAVIHVGAKPSTTVRFKEP
jgi:uncharacterized membrane protein